MSQDEEVEFPLSSDSSLTMFFDIVVMQMGIRGYGYESLAVKIVPDNDDIGIKERKVITGQLHRLAYKGAAIRDTRTLKWLWNYFITLDEWSFHLKRLAGQNTKFDLAVHISNSFKDSKHAADSSNRLGQAITDGDSVFIIDIKYIFKSFVFLKFYQTSHERIFAVLLVSQKKTDNFMASEADRKIGGYQLGYFVFDRQEAGVVVWDNNISRLMLKTFGLKSFSHTPPNVKGKLINDVHQLTELFYGEEKQEKSKVDSSYIDDDPYCEKMYTVTDARKLFTIAATSFDITIKNIDDIEVNML